MWFHNFSPPLTGPSLLYGMILLLTMDESINISMRKKEKAKLGTHSYVLIDCTKKKKKIPRCSLSIIIYPNWYSKQIFIRKSCVLNNTFVKLFFFRNYAGFWFFEILDSLVYFIAQLAGRGGGRHELRENVTKREFFFFYLMITN